MKGKDIFISYSRRDQALAFKLARALEQQGYSVWMDQERIDGATLWQKEIVEAIGASRLLILLASRASFQSDNVVRETSLAFEEKKPILPVFLEKVDIPSEFRYALAGIHRIELYQGERRQVEALLGAVRRILQKAGSGRRGRPPVPPSPAPPEKAPSSWGRQLALAGLVLALLAGGLLWTRSQKPKPPPKPSSPPALAENPAPPPESPAPKRPPPAKPKPPPKPQPEPVVSIPEPVPAEPEPEPPPPEPAQTEPEAPVVQKRAILGRYHNRREVFRGTIGFRENGTAEIEVRGIKTGMRCRGEARVNDRPGGRNCSGLRARTTLQCEPPETLTGQLAAQTCQRGLIHVLDSQGREITFRYGLSRSEIKKLLSRRLSQGRNRRPSDLPSQRAGRHPPVSDP